MFSLLSYCPISTKRFLIKASGYMIGLTLSVSALADLKQTLDWVPLNQLTKEQKEQLPLGSCGAYISPIEPLTNTINNQDLPIETSSIKSTIEENNGFKEITLIGDVIVTQGSQRLTADKAIYNEQTGVITIDGKLTIRQPDLLFLAEKGQVNQRENTLVIDNTTYVIHSANIRGSGQQLSKDNQVLNLTKSSFTHCEPSNNDWVLRGSSIVINTETHQGVAKNVRIEVRGVPVFYWPYLRFPVGDERLSGFLFPVVASSDNDINISVPYYFNLAPNYDLIVTPHFLPRHGTLIEANARHLSKRFETDITLTHLSNDKGKLSSNEQEQINNGTATLDEFNRFEDEDRWLVNINQVGGKGKRWFSLIDYNEVSDDEYLDDFDGSLLKTNSEVNLKQQIKAGYELDNWLLTINNQQFQTLGPNVARPYKQLPQITFDGNYYNDNLNISLDNEWIRFDHSDADSIGSRIITGDRTRLKYAIELDNDYEAGFFRPRLQVRHLAYQLNNQNLNIGANTSPSISVPQVVLDAGLFFDRNGSNYQQTLEPRLFYFHSPKKDQINLTGSSDFINFDTSDITFSYNQLFTDTRFSGGDRIDDANQLSIGMTTRFIHQATGEEVFSASIGKAIYFEEREISATGVINTDNNSPIAAQLNAQLSQHWQLTNNFIYDDDEGHLNDATLLLKYRSERRHLINVGYRFLRSEISANTVEQAEVSLITPINDRWNFIAHTDYDFTNNRRLEDLFGLEYSSCCYRARFAYKRFIDEGSLRTRNPITLELEQNYDEGIILEFQLLGLGSTGKQLNKLLDDSIDGYEQWRASYPLKAKN